MGNDEKTSLSRGDWVSACNFHPMDQPSVLRKVLDLVSEQMVNQSESGRRPVVLLDLDSTLYEVSPRTLTILRELREHPELEVPPKIKNILNSLSLERIGYTLPDTFTAHGFAAGDEDSEYEEFLPRIKELWKERFFSDPYLPFDRPYPGAVEYVKILHAMGAEIVYLTGREARMSEGTKGNFKRDGFPWGFANTHLMMKENAQWDDLQHKRVTAQSILKWGVPVASFENEPRNIVGFLELFPEAMHIFVETVCSELPAEICRGLYRIRDFRR